MAGGGSSRIGFRRRLAASLSTVASVLRYTRGLVLILGIMMPNVTRVLNNSSGFARCLLTTRHGAALAVCCRGSSTASCCHTPLGPLPNVVATLSAS